MTTFLIGPLPLWERQASMAAGRSGPSKDGKSGTAGPGRRRDPPVPSGLIDAFACHSAAAARPVLAGRREALVKGLAKYYYLR